jgi:hypothetical protein
MLKNIPSYLSITFLFALLHNTPLNILAAHTAGVGEERIRALFENNPKPHPRLLVSNQTEWEMRKEKILGAPDGSLWKRLYEDSAKNRGMMESAITYKINGDPLALDRVKAHIELLCVGDEKWQPYYMLESARHTRELGFLYDLLYKELNIPYSSTKSTYRDLVEKAIIEKGLQEYLVQIERGHRFVVDGANNWNHQLNAGAIIGALAVMEKHPDIAVRVLAQAVPSLHTGIRAMDPHGFWEEGVSYWQNTVIRPVVEALSSLENSLGTDFELSDSPGLRASGAFPMHMTGPTGFPLGYSDTHSQRQRWASGGGLFWLAQKFDMPVYMLDEIKSLQRHNRQLRGTGWVTLFFMPLADPEGNDLYHGVTLDKFYGTTGDPGDESQLVVFRSEWDNEEALFGSLKGGHSSKSHAHLDLGTFELQALGEQWTVELGYGNWVNWDYFINVNPPIATADVFRDYGYFQDAGVNGNRWNIYNVSSRSHNVPLIENQNQHIIASTVFEKFESEPSFAYAVLNLTGAYAGKRVVEMRRGMQLLAERSGFLIQDEYMVEGTIDIEWGMSTDATITISKDGKQATLSKNGKKMTFTILDSPNTPADAVFTQRKPRIGVDIVTPLEYRLTGKWRSRVADVTVNIAKIEQRLIQDRSPGFTRLVIELSERTGEVTLPIWIAPKGSVIVAPHVVDLDHW